MNVRNRNLKSKEDDVTTGITRFRSRKRLSALIAAPVVTQMPIPPHALVLVPATRRPILCEEKKCRKDHGMKKSVRKLRRKERGMKKLGGKT